VYSTLDIAIYGTVHNSPGGATALSKRVNIPPSSLNNKANMGIDDRHFSPAELLALMLQTGDFQILHAIAADCGFVCKPIHSNPDQTPNLMALLARVTKENGDLATVLLDASADGVISSNERKQIITEAMGAIKALHDLARSASGIST